MLKCLQGKLQLVNYHLQGVSNAGLGSVRTRFVFFFSFLHKQHFIFRALSKHFSQALVVAR